MKIDDYADFTNTTAIYPDAGTGSFQEWNYLIMGLNGEASELLQAYMWGRGNGIADREEIVANYLKELGDVIWYWARSIRAAGEDPSNIIEAQSLAEVSLPYDLPEEGEDTLFNIIKSAGRLAEYYKKWIRDGSWHYDRMLAELSLMGYSIVATCRLLEVDPNDVVEANMVKLSSRKERGVLKGSGDNR